MPKGEPPLSDLRVKALRWFPRGGLTRSEIALVLGVPYATIIDIEQTALDKIRATYLTCLDGSTSDGR